MKITIQIHSDLRKEIYFLKIELNLEYGYISRVNKTDLFGQTQPLSINQGNFVRNSNLRHYP